MTEQLNAFAVCHNTCFRRTRQVSNLLKSAISNKNNGNNNYKYYYYYNSNKITIVRCGLEVFFGGFRRISVIGCISVFLVAAVGEWVKCVTCTLVGNLALTFYELLKINIAAKQTW